MMNRSLHRIAIGLASISLAATLVGCSDDSTVTPEMDAVTLPTPMAFDAEIVFGSPAHVDFRSVLRFPGITFYGSNRAIFVEMGSQWLVYKFDAAGTQLPRGGASFGYVHGLWGTSPTNVYAVGDGAVLRFDGTTWSVVHAVEAELNEIFGFSDSDIYVVGRNTILHFDGASWTNHHPDEIFAEWYGVWGSDTNTIFVAGSGGRILRGARDSWTALDSGTTQVLEDVWGTSSTEVFAVGHEAAVVRFNGVSWDPLTPPLRAGGAPWFYGVWGTSGDNVYMAGGRNDIYRYLGGFDWTVESVEDGAAMYDVTGLSESDVVIGAQSGVAFSYDGSEWTWPGAPHSGSTIDMWGIAADDIYATGNLGTVLHYDGVDWTPVDVGSDEFLWGVWGSASNNVFIGGDNGTMLRWDGTSWTQMVTNTTGFIRGVWGLDANNVYACGENGEFLYYDGNVSNTWQIFSTGGGEWLWDVWADDTDDVWIGGIDVLYRFDGEEFTAQTPPITTGWRSIWGNRANNIWFVGQDGFIMRWNGFAFDPVVRFTDEWLDSIYGFADDDIYACGQNAEFFKWDGSTWSQLSVGGVGTLKAIWGASPDELWIASGNGAPSMYVYRP